MITIQFTEDFATKKKGDIWTCDGQLAAHLIGVDKVAVKYNAEEAPAEEAPAEEAPAEEAPAEEAPAEEAPAEEAPAEEAPAPKNKPKKK